MILITGGHGFIGQATAKTLVRAGQDVVLTRYRSSSLLPELQRHLGKAVQVVDFDVREPMAMLDTIRRLKVKRIIHLASGHWSASLPTDFNTNTAGLIHLLEAARQAEVERITIGSSITVYFGNTGPYRENHPLFQEERPAESLAWCHAGLLSSVGQDVAAFLLADSRASFDRCVVFQPERRPNQAGDGDEDGWGSSGELSFELV